MKTRVQCSREGLPICQSVTVGRAIGGEGSFRVGGPAALPGSYRTGDWPAETSYHTSRPAVDLCPADAQNHMATGSALLPSRHPVPRS